MQLDQHLMNTGVVDAANIFVVGIRVGEINNLRLNGGITWVSKGCRIAPLYRSGRAFQYI